MRRALVSLTVLLALAVIARVVMVESAGVPVTEATGNEPSALKAAVNAGSASAGEGAVAAATDPAPAFVPTYFPKARVIAKVSDPRDNRGRQRVIETVETKMKQKYVRVVSTYVSDGRGGVRRTGEVAMVANQLLLEKPAALDGNTFSGLIKQAGAVDVKAISADAYLATFAAHPENPRALDANMSRVKQVAGNDVTVEPNYVRKIF